MSVESPVHLRHGTRHFHNPQWRFFGIVVAAVVGFALIYGITFASQLSGAIDARDSGDLIDDVPDRPDGPDWPTDGSAGRPLNILLMGSDEADGDIATDSREGMRNDTTILVHVSADRSRVQMISIPRDLQVRIPDCRLNDGTVVRGWTGNFNISFSNGGRQGDPSEAAACTVNTVQQLTGITIDHWVVVDFTGFVSMVDALGGVPMCVPERIVSRKAKLDLEAGAQVLDGETALAFARLRTAEVGDVSGSDLQRINRQQELMRNTAELALAKNLLTDMGELTQFIRAGAESLTMDSDLARMNTLLGLAYSLRELRVNDIEFATVPWEYSDDFITVNLRPEAEQMWDDIIWDRPLSVQGEDDHTSEWDSGRVDNDTSSGNGSSGSGSNGGGGNGSGSGSGNGGAGSGADAPVTSAEDLLDACARQ